MLFLEIFFFATVRAIAQRNPSVLRSLLIPNSPGDLVNLGSHLAQDSPEEALLCLEMALRYSPSDPDITALADQIRGQFEPDLDLQLSERTEQALRDITGGGETKSSTFESEEDMLEALVSAEHEDSTPEIPQEADEYGNIDVPVSEEFKLADEEDVSNVLPEEETAGDTQDEPVDQLAGEIESIQSDTGDIDEIMTESSGAGENTEMVESAAMIEAESAPAETCRSGSTHGR